MTASSSTQEKKPPSRAVPLLVLTSVGLLVFCLLFLLVDQSYFRLISTRFPNVGTSFWLATAWGLASRAHWIVVIIAIFLLWPRLLALQVGETKAHWRLLLVMLLINCGVVAAYLIFSGSTTPYSGNQWLLTEVVTVPLVEELFWRGLVFSILLKLLQYRFSGAASLSLAAWLSGLAFGLLHAGNALAGVPVLFVAIQTLNAAIWGVLYGYARARTGSVYPSVFLHAAMNLVVVAL
jgi:membrane protease YdiL (CAAX protease family)